MTDPNYTHVSLVVDRSGSMSSIQSDAEGGINSFVVEQAKLDSKCTVTLYEFDTYYDKVYGPVNIKDAPAYSLIPRGSTALLDATGRAIVETGEFLTALSEDERPGTVIFVVVTDGGENASKEFTQASIKELVENHTNTYGWQFVYLAANVDAFDTGSALGYTSNVQYAGTGASTRAAYSNLNTAVYGSRTTGVAVAAAMPTDIDEDGNATTNP